MSSSLTRLKPNGGMVNPIMEIRESHDMIHWSEPVHVLRDGSEFGGHYVGMYWVDDGEQPFVISDDTVAILRNGNGTDVIRCYGNFEDQ